MQPKFWPVHPDSPVSFVGVAGDSEQQQQSARGRGEEGEQASRWHVRGGGGGGSVGKPHAPT